MSHLFRLFAAAGLAAFAVLVIVVGLARHNADLLAPFNFFALIVFMVLYIVPTALALYRNCRATAWIAALNILLGWTLFGWAIALGWAASGKVAEVHPTLPSPPGPALQGH
ncbi:MAG: superinfection immunity protein [Terracidiphilus sp.]